MDALKGMVDNLALFPLVLARFSGLFLAMPLFGSRAIPLGVRVMLALGLSWAFLPLMSRAIKEPELDVWPLSLAILREGLMGLAMGWLVQLILSAVPLAAQVLGYQMGLGIANVMDPVGQHQMSVTAQILQLLALWLFLQLDGHHLVLRGLMEEPGKGLWEPSLGPLHGSIEAGRHLFSSALSLAAPALMILLFVQLGLGLLARMVPQMNIFIVTAPFQVGLGLIAMGMALGTLGQWLPDGLLWLEGAMEGLFRLAF
jgi:flagellar biosynthetic protein FliR